MELSMHMNWAAANSGLALGLAFFGLVIWPGPQASGRDLGSAGTTLAQAEASPDQRPRARGPARIRVNPLVQSYPGPNSVRQCVSWIEPEYRPGGTVIVPRMHCWWERG
jgi:hypothetical protein